MPTWRFFLGILGSLIGIIAAVFLIDSKENNEAENFLCLYNLGTDQLQKHLLEQKL